MKWTEKQYATEKDFMSTVKTLGWYTEFELEINHYNLRNFRLDISGQILGTYLPNREKARCQIIRNVGS